VYCVMSKRPRRLTQRPLKFAAVRMPESDRDLWFAAAKVTGESQSAFLRRVLRAASVATIAEARVDVEAADK
jgi:hypothetical protein